MTTKNVTLHFKIRQRNNQSYPIRAFLNIYLLFYIFETKSDIFYVRIIHFIHDKTGFTNKSIEVPNYGTRNDTINLFLMKKNN